MWGNKAKLYAYVIMDNHVHLLIEVSDETLSKIMQLIQQTFTQHYNKKYNRTGHLFEQRYKAINCDKEAYLLALIRYIHQNPIRAGISDINYQWSSHKEYKTYRPKNCDIQFPLSLFSTDKKKAVQMYMELIEDEDTIKGKTSYELMPDEIVPEEVIIKNRKVINKEIKVEDLIAEAELLHNIKFEMLKGRSENREISQIKEGFIKNLTKYKLLNQKQLSELLEVSEQTISRIVNKV
ncbi:MAG: hypothetical protein JM58_07630 [Peptococcaceae bacterium BICA1-8]|nr:MAG: hypothetical protein JM58_07630 [Peptococcaceae bacterium BICA1-8]